MHSICDTKEGSSRTNLWACAAWNFRLNGCVGQLGRWPRGDSIASPLVDCVGHHLGAHEAAGSGVIMEGVNVIMEGVNVITKTFEACGQRSNMPPAHNVYQHKLSRNAAPSNGVGWDNIQDNVWRSLICVG